ncbi:MAG: cellulase family glycosylhydrolase [Bacteroidetes bacterium]|nr:cellulase family glycosylhydrolase [Bacteroidota bacterium]
MNNGIRKKSAAGQPIKFSMFFLLLIFSMQLVQAQTSTHITTSGRWIIGPCGDTLLLKGINYAPYNWGWSPAQLQINQLAQTGANCVRLPWYVNTPDGPTPQATYNNLVNLDSALAACVRFDMIPIIELHDQTCQNNVQALTTLASWFTQPAVLALITQYQHSIIVNVANEALYVNWTANPQAAQNTFQNTYSSIVTTLRNAGINVPIMIDGPDCGTNLDVLAATGPALIAADPQSNLIFSAHAYWYAYANNDSLQMQNKVNNALAQNIPFVFGEIANLQDDQQMCQYTLNYQPLLRICRQHQIGWMAWSWNNDGCAARQMSTNGNFANLTAYGTDLIYNPGYGLLTQSAEKSSYLLNNGCLSLSMHTHNQHPEINLVPNPGNGIFTVVSTHPLLRVEAANLAGQAVGIVKSGTSVWEIEHKTPGMYLVTVIDENGFRITKKLVVN